MTSDKAMFSHIVPRNGGYITVGDNAKSKIVGEGKVGNDPNPTIDNVLLINGLKHNLLSISQFFDKHFKVVFEPLRCVFYDVDGNILIVGVRYNNIYIVYLLDFNAFNKN